jgi:hypothetical protein
MARGEASNLARQQLPSVLTTALTGDFYIIELYIINNGSSTGTVSVQDGNSNPFIPNNLSLSPGAMLSGTFNYPQGVFMPNGLIWGANQAGFWGFVIGVLP